MLSFGFYSYFFKVNDCSCSLDDKGVSVYFQDLNTAEYRQYPGNNISPELISRIHHFQDRPFGLPIDSSLKYISDCISSFVTLVVAVALFAFVLKVF